MDCRRQLARECIGGFSSEVVRIEGHLIWAVAARLVAEATIGQHHTSLILPA
jgi:hypothetical protein